MISEMCTKEEGGLFWDFDFRRRLMEATIEEATSLITLLEDVQLTNEEDNRQRDDGNRYFSA